MEWKSGVRTMCAGGAGQVIKLEGRAALMRKLEDPAFRRDFIANPPLPPGRDIWKDNERLEIRVPNDPLLYTWPEGQDFASYDPVLKRNWEDEMFELKWFGKARNHIQGGDWANFRISTEVPPRIKIYYANMVERFQKGALIGATLVFNNLLTDYLAPRGQIPYGVYHTMLVIYKKRERFDRALDMFNEIVSHHTPTPDDYALGMEVLLNMHAPKEALEVWRSFQTRPSLKPNASMYSMLIKTYSMLGEIENMDNAFKHAQRQAQDGSNSKLDILPVYATMIDTYASLGYREELLELLQSITAKDSNSIILTALQALNTVGLGEQVIANFDVWLPRKDHVGIAFYNELIKAHVQAKDVKALEKLLTMLSNSKIDLDVNSYICLIENKFKLAESSVVYQLANDGLALKNIRPSIRNYRSVHAANVTANATGDFGVSVSTVKDLASKKIEFDAALLEAVSFAQAANADLSQAVSTWREVVILGKLIPTRKTFTNFFTVAGIEKSPLNAALAWRLSQLLFVQPDYRFASALSLAIQPDRNYFGLVETRRQHQKWTEQSSSSRVLNKTQLEEFTRFIDHAISTFSEADKTTLEREWKAMLKDFAKPRKETAVQQDEEPSARPSASAAPSGPLKRLFQQQAIPTPGQPNAEVLAAEAAAAAAPAPAPATAAGETAETVEEVAAAASETAADASSVQESSS